MFVDPANSGLMMFVIFSILQTIIIIILASLRSFQVMDTSTLKIPILSKYRFVSILLPLLLETLYCPGFIVITEVMSPDVLEVGEILKIILRNGRVLFLVMLSDATRNDLGFFEALPSDTVALTSFEALFDYKPLIKRGESLCYPFVLHHHVGPPPLHNV
jgi:hypothetical protein